MDKRKSSLIIFASAPNGMVSACVFTCRRNAAVSLGRFDQYMYKYFECDIDNGVLDKEQAKELLKCFWLKTCEGDESQNLTLGGDSENELSLLCLEVTKLLKKGVDF